MKAYVDLYLLFCINVAKHVKKFNCQLYCDIAVFCKNTSRPI